MDKAAKQVQVQELRDLLQGKESVVLTDYRGMSVEEMFNLRRACDKQDVGYRIVKNTLAKLAIAGTEYEVLAASLEGPVGWVYSADPVAPAKVLTDFIKDCKHLEIKLGCLNGKVLQASDVEALSKLPSMDQLRSQFLSVLSAPATKFVGVLAATPRDLVGVLAARQEALA